MVYLQFLCRPLIFFTLLDYLFTRYMKLLAHAFKYVTTDQLEINIRRFTGELNRLSRNIRMPFPRCRRSGYTPENLLKY